MIAGLAPRARYFDPRLSWRGPFGRTKVRPILLPAKLSCRDNKVPKETLPGRSARGSLRSSRSRDCAVQDVRMPRSAWMRESGRNSRDRLRRYALRQCSLNCSRLRSGARRAPTGKINSDSEISPNNSSLTLMSSLSMHSTLAFPYFFSCAVMTSSIL